MYVIGLSGKCGSGKDYVAKNIILPILSRKPNIKPFIIAFADHLKEECCAKYGYTYNDIYVEKDVTARKKLQELGETNKSTYNKHYYANIVKLRIQLLRDRNDINFIIITDLRFPEEVDIIRELGGHIFRIESSHAYGRNSISQVYQHCSETALDNYDFDAYLSNEHNATDKLRTKVEELLESITSK